MAVLRTNTGKEYPCISFCCPNEFMLSARIDIDISEMMTVFQDPDETIDMCWIDNFGYTVKTTHGFTVFKGFDIVGGDYPVCIRMTKKATEV